MEHGGAPQHVSETRLLAVVDPSSSNWGEDDLVHGLKPKSSPLPRRKSSCSLDDSDLGPPLTQSRRVSFADALGLSLVSVKEFDAWAIPTLVVADPVDGEAQTQEEYFLSCLFTVPGSQAELSQIVGEKKVELESVELLPGSTTLRGFVQVLNFCFHKTVYVRTTLDSWHSHFDLLAEFVPGSSNGRTDRFSFRLTLVPPFGTEGTRVEFCLRYETPVGTFWANNGGMNYVLFCKKKDEEVDGRPQTRDPDRPRRSCLKVVSKGPLSDACPPTLPADIPDVPGYNEVLVATEMWEMQPSAAVNDDKHHKTTGDKSPSYCRRSQRRAARLAQIRDYFAQREMLAATENKDTAAETNGKEPTPLCETTPPLAQESEGKRTPASGLEASDVWNGAANKQQKDAWPYFLQGEGLRLAGSGLWEAKGMDTMASIAMHEAAGQLGCCLISGKGDGISQVELLNHPDAVCHSVKDSSLANQVSLVDQSDASPGGSAQLGTSDDREVSEWDINARGDISSDIKSDVNMDPCTQASRFTGDNAAKVTTSDDSHFSDPPFTFETFVAPLYQQAFHRAEAENLCFGDNEEEEGSEEMEDEGQPCIAQTKAMTFDDCCDCLTSIGEDGSTDMLAFPVYNPEGAFKNNAAELMQSSADANVGGMSASSVQTLQEPNGTMSGPASHSATLTEQEDHLSEEKGKGDLNNAQGKVKQRETLDEEEKALPVQGVVVTLVEEIVNKGFLTVTKLDEEERETFLKEVKGEKSLDRERLEKEKSLANDHKEMAKNDGAQRRDCVSAGEDTLVKREDLKEQDVEILKKDGAHEDDAEVTVGKSKMHLQIPQKNEEEGNKDVTEGTKVRVHEERETISKVEEEYNHASEDKEDEFGQNNINLHEEDRDEAAVEEVVLEKEKAGIREGADGSGEKQVNFHDVEILCTEGHQTMSRGEWLVKEDGVDQGCLGTEKEQEEEGEEDSSSTESLSDEEMEQYLLSMKSLQKFCPTAPEPQRDTMLSTRKRPSVSRGRMTLVALTSITECLNEDCDAEEEGWAAAPLESPSPVMLEDEQSGSMKDLLWWRDSLASSDASRVLLCGLLLALFFMAAYYYEFITCCAFYLLSVYWLCWHGEKDRLKVTDGIRSAVR